MNKLIILLFIVMIIFMNFGLAYTVEYKHYDSDYRYNSEHNYNSGYNHKNSYYPYHKYKEYSLRHHRILPEREYYRDYGYYNRRPCGSSVNINIYNSPNTNVDVNIRC